MNVHHTLAAALAVAALNVSAQTVDPKAAAKNEIDATASNICTTIPLDGKSQSGGLSASAEVNLNGMLGKLLSKLGDLKLKGSAEYSKQSFRNVLQKDLAQAIAASDNCRLAVLTVLNGKLLPDATSSGQSVGSVTATGTGSAAIGISNGTVNIGNTSDSKK